MRVLVTGLDQANFLVQLYTGIKQYRKDIFIGTTGLRDQGTGGKQQSNTTAFDEIYSINKVKKKYFAAALAVLAFSKWFYSLLLYILVVEGNIKKAAHFCLQAIKETAFFKSHAGFNTYDVFHFHFIQYSYIRTVWLVPRGKKIICSFWGSDLLRTSDSFNHFVVGKVLRKADIITVQSIELREILLAKFGRALKSKTRVVLFNLNEDAFSQIDDNRGNTAAIANFCTENGISDSKVNVVVGHNASPYNNHLAIIASLAKLPQSQRLCVVVPFAYGIAPNEREAYRLTIENALKDASLPYAILDKYFTGTQLALLRLATDVYLHLPESDALSAALTEAAYAGAVVIAGDWLPYSPFKKAGMQLIYAEPGDDLAMKLEDVLSNLQLEKDRIGHLNKAAISSHFFTAETTKGWLGIFDELNT